MIHKSNDSLKWLRELLQLQPYGDSGLDKAGQGFQNVWSLLFCISVLSFAGLWLHFGMLVFSNIAISIFFAVLVPFFLGSLEMRFKRSLALRSLHALRSLAHVVDMHQLTKDPAVILAGTSFRPTESSPARSMTPYQLTRYLEYCSEMLSLTSKLAAMHVQYFDDPVVLDAVNDIESLTQGLSNKVWQKIMILDLAGPE